MHFLGNSKGCPRVPKFWRWEQELPIWRFRQNKGASINGMWARCAKSSQSALVQFWIPPLDGGPRRILRSWKARNCRTSPPHIAHLCSPGVNEVSLLDKSLAKIEHLKIRFEVNKKLGLYYIWPNKGGISKSYPETLAMTSEGLWEVFGGDFEVWYKVMHLDLVTLNKEAWTDIVLAFES